MMVKIVLPVKLKTNIHYLHWMTAKPKLNLFDLTMIVTGLVIGMGIFRTASDAAQAATTPAVFFPPG
jgi:hypothetical protein